LKRVKAGWPVIIRVKNAMLDGLLPAWIRINPLPNTPLPGSARSMFSDSKIQEFHGFVIRVFHVSSHSYSSVQPPTGPNSTTLLSHVKSDANQA